MVCHIALYIFYQINYVCYLWLCIWLLTCYPLSPTPPLEFMPKPFLLRLIMTKSFVFWKPHICVSWFLDFNAMFHLRVKNFPKNTRVAISCFAAFYRCCLEILWKMLCVCFPLKYSRLFTFSIPFSSNTHTIIPSIDTILNSVIFNDSSEEKNNFFLNFGYT